MKASQVIVIILGTMALVAVSANKLVGLGIAAVIVVLMGLGELRRKRGSR